MINQRSGSINPTYTGINTELVELLKKVTTKTFLGTCIHVAMTTDFDKMLLVKELKSISEDNADAIRRTIGERAFFLLMEGKA